MSSPKDIDWELLFFGRLAAKCQSKKKHKCCSLLEQSHSVLPWAVSEPGRWRTSSSFLLYPSILTHGPPASRCQWCSPLHHLETGQESLLEWAKRAMLIKLKHMIKYPAEHCRSADPDKNSTETSLAGYISTLFSTHVKITWLKRWQWQSLARIRMQELASSVKC